MRALDKWSASSFIVTAPRPCQGEPSRRMSRPLGFAVLLLEEARVDGLQARIVDREATQRSVGGDHGARCFRAHVAVGREPGAVRADPADLAHALHGAEAP